MNRAQVRAALSGHLVAECWIGDNRVELKCRCGASFDRANSDVGEPVLVMIDDYAEHLVGLVTDPS